MKTEKKLEQYAIKTIGFNTCTVRKLFNPCTEKMEYCITGADGFKEENFLDTNLALSKKAIDNMAL